jgi:putative flippase GtrA
MMCGVRRARLTAWLDRLPPRLRRWVPRELAGFAVIGAFTLSVDLTLLTLLRDHTRLPLTVAMSIAYLSAFGLNFGLNRTLNFRSHAPVSGQLVRYAVVLIGDYLLTVGVSTGLAATGLNFQLARLTASFFVAVFTYSASRWWVFRDRDRDGDRDGDGDGGPAREAAPVAALRR